MRAILRTLISSAVYCGTLLPLIRLIEWRGTDARPGAINVNERAGTHLKLAQTVNEVPGKVVRVVAAVKEQKEAETCPQGLRFALDN